MIAQRKRARSATTIVALPTATAICSMPPLCGRNAGRRKARIGGRVRDVPRTITMFNQRTTSSYTPPPVANAAKNPKIHRNLFRHERRSDSRRTMR
jgi:hypothetical protein